MLGVRMFDRDSTPISIRIGTVSTPQSFLQSPDAEIISAGTNSRSCRSVAIGRHGNYLGWGFAIDPSHMTPAAKAMFVNSVVYISKFSGKTPKTTIPTGGFLKRQLIYQPRDALLDVPSALRNAKAVYQDSLTTLEEQKRTVNKIEAIAETRTLTQYEQLYLRMARRTVKTLDGKKTESESEFVQNHFKRHAGQKLFNQFGMDIQSYDEHFQQLAPTSYFDPSKFDFVVCKESQELGIPVGDVRILDKAIEMLESDSKNKTANTLLRRYTTERFKSPEEWRDWLTRNRSRLFFHEVAGYKFFVNDLDRSFSATADPDERPMGKTEEWEPDQFNPVSITISLEANRSAPKSTYMLRVRFKILEKWHIYKTGDAKGVYTPTKIALELPEGVSMSEDWKQPDAKTGSAGTQIYENDVQFERTLKFDAELKGTVSIPVTIEYMACDANRCLPSKKEKHTASVSVKK